MNLINLTEKISFVIAVDLFVSEIYNENKSVKSTVKWSYASVLWASSIFSSLVERQKTVDEEKGKKIERITGLNQMEKKTYLTNIRYPTISQANKAFYVNLLLVY